MHVLKSLTIAEYRPAGRSAASPVDYLVARCFLIALLLRLAIAVTVAAAVTPDVMLAKFFR